MTTLLLGLVLLGIIFITLEVFLPGGVLGVLAAICFVASVAIAFQVGEDNTLGFATLFGVMFIGMAYLFFFTVVLPKSKLGQRFALHTNIDAKGTDDTRNLLYREGEAITDLHPGGIARIDGGRIDVVSATGYISAGTRIRVVHTDGSSVSVQEVTPGDPPPPRTPPQASGFPEF